MAWPSKSPTASGADSPSKNDAGCTDVKRGPARKGPPESRPSIGGGPDWTGGHGKVTVVGVEGTSSYRRGIATALRVAGIRVVEVNRTRLAERRRQGKSDRLDAYRAARSVLSGEATTRPRTARSSRCGR